MKKTKTLWSLAIYFVVLIVILVGISEILLISKFLSQPPDTIPDSRYKELLNYADIVTNVYQGKSEQRIPNLNKAGIELDTNIYEGTDQEDLRFNITIQDKEYNSEIRITYPVKFNSNNNAIIGTDYRQVETESHNITIVTIICASVLCAVILILAISILVMSTKNGKYE